MFAVNADDAIVYTMVVGVLLFLLCVSMAWTAYRRKQSADWILRSNARVLREFRSICLHRPHHIITVSPLERFPREDDPTHP